MTGIKKAYKNNIRILRKGDKEFPEILSSMDEPVKELYCIGDVSLLKERAVAVVGARKCSQYGRRAAFNIGKSLAYNNVATVSGMAAGIDSMAHSGALEEGGDTIAVLGCGPDICYPKANEQLYERICEEGLVISEYPPGTPPRPWHFPMRNRIIAALCHAVVVAEAGEKSGALITSLKAAELGSEVFALPGNITSPYSRGTNMLIRDGARIITSIEELLEELNLAKAGADSSEAELGGEEKIIYDIVMEQGEATVDFLCAALNKTPSYISGILSVMEMKGIVYYELGKIFIAKCLK